MFYIANKTDWVSCRITENRLFTYTVDIRGTSVLPQMVMSRDLENNLSAFTVLLDGIR